MRPARALAIAALSFASLGGVARASDDARERSRASFRLGVVAAERGSYADARDAFLEAYRLFPHPSILLNLGIARWKTGAYPDAEVDLAKFLADDGGASPEEIASARAALAAVRDHLGTLRVTVSPAGARASVDQRPIALVAGSSVDVRVAAGEHAVRVEAEGYEPIEQRVRVAPGQTWPLVLALPPRAPQGEASAAGSPRRDGGLVLVGLGALLAGGGAAAGGRALYLAGAYDDPTSARYQDHGTKTQGVAYRTAADVLFAGALVAGGVGAWLLFTSPSAPTRAGLTLAPGFVGAGGAF